MWPEVAAGGCEKITDNRQKAKSDHHDIFPSPL